MFMGRGQVSFEVLVGIALILVFFTVVSLDAYSRSGRASELKTFLHAREVVRVFAENVGSVSSAGDGFYRYFSLPARLEGGYNYSIGVDGVFVDLFWGDGRGAGDTLASGNVTVYCLNYSGGPLNRIANRRGAVEVTCGMPDLGFLEDRVVVKDGVLYAPVVNDGPVPSPAFTITFNGTLDQNIMFLGAGGEIVLEYGVGSMPEGAIVNLSVDSHDNVVESIESNNEIEVTI